MVVIFLFPALILISSSNRYSFTPSDEPQNVAALMRLSGILLETFENEVVEGGQRPGFVSTATEQQDFLQEQISGGCGWLIDRFDNIDAQKRSADLYCSSFSVKKTRVKNSLCEGKMFAQTGLTLRLN